MSKTKDMNVSLASMAFFGLCSILVIYTVSTSATFGVSAIATWLIVILVFFIPNAYICAELGSTWAGDGGIYVWVKKAFGPFLASQVAWLYWVNVVFFIPTVMIALVGNVNTFFFPNMSKFAIITSVVSLTWLIVLLGITNMKFTQKITSYGGIVIVTLISTMFILATIYGFQHGFANDFSLHSFKPSLAGVLAFAPLVIFNLMGSELLCSIASKLDNPQKNVPKFIMISGALVAVFYILGSISILEVIPVDKINSVSGITDSFSIIVGGVLGPKFAFLSSLMVVAVLYCLFASATAWVMGSCNVMVQTGIDTKSKILGHKHPKYDTPDYLYYIIGIFGTLYTLLNYLGGSSVESIFWVMLAFSSILYQLPYLVMYLAVIRLRYVEKDAVRPCKIPGGMVGAWICGLLSAGCLFCGIIVFSLPPEGTADPITYELEMWGGLFLVMAIGVCITLFESRRNKVALNALS